LEHGSPHISNPDDAPKPSAAMQVAERELRSYRMFKVIDVWVEPAWGEERC
jgi:hypothetical protein